MFSGAQTEIGYRLALCPSRRPISTTKRSSKLALSFWLHRDSFRVLGMIYGWQTPSIASHGKRKHNLRLSMPCPDARGLLQNHFPRLFSLVSPLSPHFLPFLATPPMSLHFSSGMLPGSLSPAGLGSPDPCSKKVCIKILQKSLWMHICDGKSI